ncbi:MAG: alpha/beta hydrolase-fold protein [candidate division Zixibacteria bacterium]|nr:alpha/beta hydrolase-fold protein [candidate division Zixibacteria bacterium]
MHNIIKIMAVFVALAFVVSLACSDRGANIQQSTTNLPPAPGRHDHSFYNEMMVQIGNPQQMIYMDAYIPNRTYDQEPLPLVILLPPQNGTESYYFNHGLSEIADELIAKDEIVPMAIVTLKNHRSFGGFFWAGNGGGSGNYDTLIGNTLLDYLNESSEGFYMNDPRYRGIGGIGQGSYGAFRAAILHPGAFSSIAVADGPLDFDGADGESGFENLFESVLAEQGLLNYTPVNDTTWTDLFDSLSIYPNSRMFIGGALAFSPHDTLVIPFGARGFPPKTPIPMIDTLFDTSSVEGEWVVDTIIDTLRWQIEDTVTLCTEIVNTDENDFEFHLPFDSAGKPYEPIWDSLWLPNNLENMLDTYGDNCLEDVGIWIATTQDPSEQSRTFGYQTRSWIETLEGKGLLEQENVFEYSGYEGNPATNDQYIYDLLREMLIFHSRNFEAADSIAATE